MAVKTIKIAISACLLGEKVRYDGNSKCHEPIIKVLRNNPRVMIKWVPFCPEVGIGLSVPRDKIQLEKVAEQIRVVGVLNHTWDVTDELKSFSLDFMQKQADIDAYIVKSKSPSCGYQSTPVFQSVYDQRVGDQREQGVLQCPGLTSGMFTRTISAHNPKIVIVEESQLQTENDCRYFLQQLIAKQTIAKK